ncbi:hypothetical protein TrCOL_g796 [Triparma columacea]|uniref:histidine--tRNA ligase n=1 Tax=Triparma columacea TaxID=722753 RepID=A0A9W7G6Z0_9STRA|nr:hypothetical protein TrCOL_g796 [Triparma columacea]
MSTRLMSTRLMSTSSNDTGGGGRRSAEVVRRGKEEEGGEGKKVKVEKLDVKPPKGTRDFPPSLSRQQTWLFSHFHAVSKSYGFSHYDSPILESTSLYTRKAGEEVTEQLYSFLDKGGRPVSLRPEMTPSLARMVMGLKPTLPIKWYSIPQCWRYERSTRGRRREHYQWNVDIWGVEGEAAEAEVLAGMVDLMRSVGLTSDDVGIKINSRAVLREVTEKMGIGGDKFASVCVLVDKLEKVPIEAIEGDLKDLGIGREVVEELLTVLGSKTIDDLAEHVGEESEAVRDLRSLLRLLDFHGVSDWMVFDASVVRGLSYYTGVVFEAFDRTGNLRAIAGGGRYDGLVETYGGERTPAVGFGFGDAVIVELLKDKGLLPDFERGTVDYCVAGVEGPEDGEAVRAAGILRGKGMSVDLVLEKRKMKWVFKHADRIGARKVVITGGEEGERGECIVKDMDTGEQVAVKLGEL